MAESVGVEAETVELSPINNQRIGGWWEKRLRKKWLVIRGLSLDAMLEWIEREAAEAAEIFAQIATLRQIQDAGLVALKSMRDELEGGYEPEKEEDSVAESQPGAVGEQFQNTSSSSEETMNKRKREKISLGFLRQQGFCPTALERLEYVLPYLDEQCRVAQRGCIGEAVDAVTDAGLVCSPVTIRSDIANIRNVWRWFHEGVESHAALRQQVDAKQPTAALLAAVIKAGFKSWESLGISAPAASVDATAKPKKRGMPKNVGKRQAPQGKDVKTGFPALPDVIVKILSIPNIAQVLWEEIQKIDEQIAQLQRQRDDYKEILNNATAVNKK